MGHDLQPFGGPGRPVVEVGPPGREVAPASLRLDQVVVAAEVAQVVAVADVAADLLADRGRGPLHGRVQLGIPGRGPGPEAGQGAKGLAIDPAVAVVVEAELDPGAVQVGAGADPADAWGALVAGAERPGSEELAGGTAPQQRVQGRPVARADLPAVAVVELDRRQQATVAGAGHGGLGGRLVDDRPVGPAHQVRGGGQVAGLVVVVHGQVAAGRARDDLGGVHAVAGRVVGVVPERGGGADVTE
jgi:hypothetical protein